MRKKWESERSKTLQAYRWGDIDVLRVKIYMRQKQQRKEEKNQPKEIH